MAKSETSPVDAPGVLKDAWEAIGNRANERDDAAVGERSMAATVNAFNALYGTELTETQGWMFMVVLKAARARQGALQMDDYVDGAAYMALAGESAHMEQFKASLDKVSTDLQEQQAIFLSNYVPAV